MTDAVHDDVRAERAVELARRFLADSLAELTAPERRRQERLGRLLADPSGRELIFALTDEVLRIREPRLAARRFADVVRRHGGAALGFVDRGLLRAGALAGPLLPRLVMPLVVKRVKAETAGIVLPAEDPAFAEHVRRRRAEGVRLNVNPLGEAILSDDEADARLELVLQRIARPDVDYVSVKVSAIVANLDAFAFADSVERICARLRTVYRAAAAATPRTFVNLDMEEYRDLELTLQSFIRILDEEEFHGTDAGIVLQAYLPDSHGALERLGEWAARRRAAGGGKVKVRLVKGANLAMESVEAELRGWVAAPYASKAEVDASYKRMLDRALDPAWADALSIGVASHNLFDVAWAMVVAGEAGAGERVEFEMLEGMAPAQARVVQRAAHDLLLYAPVVAAHDFEASIAYLSRRLDENTQPDNFLRALFTLRPDTPGFAAEADRFRASVRDRHTVSTARRRGRRTSGGGQPAPVFHNEPDGDPTDAAWREATLAAIAAAPTVAVSPIEDTAAIDAAMARAGAAAQRLAEVGEDVRRGWLSAVAELMSAERSLTLGLMATHADKIVREGDAEVSEAIDFCRYDASDGLDHVRGAAERGLQVEPRGVVLVVGPWNFPYAIPVGGVAAAIAAGNSVVLKPSPEAAVVGAHIVDQFHRAGVPGDVVQLVVCADGPVGRHLVTHPGFDTVVLTGSFETAAMFAEWNPQRRLLAETSGKNALVITASADLDLAIADLVRSAFGHAGQKCSAASLGIVEASVYDDPSFTRRLAAATCSLRLGEASDPSAMMTPLVQEPGEALQRALTTLEPGERWLVEPRRWGDSRRWSPGIRVGVRPGSWFQRTECFGPVLGLIRVESLAEAIEVQNSTDYGLTGGIHSLDEDEIGRWLGAVQIGNAYVNRHITGAIVRRQPFGGWKRSSFGGGVKAGGPGYVGQLMRFTDPAPTMVHAGERYGAAWREHFSRDHDPNGLQAESNLLRYHPLRSVAVRVGDHDELRRGMAELAGRVAGVPVLVSTPSIEDDLSFAERAVAEGVERVRALVPLADAARRILHRAAIAVVDEPIVADGLVELQHWVREQAISRTMHRHGRIVGG